MPVDEPEIRLTEVKGIFFDFGDTLATLSPSKEELFVSSARSVGLELDVEAVRSAYHIVDFQQKYSSVHVKDRADFYHNYNQLLCEALGISSHFPRLHSGLVTNFHNAKKWELFQEVPEVLLDLRERGITLALVANWDSNLSSLTEKLGIREAFSAIVSSQIAGVEKPDPVIFLRAADELSLSVTADPVLYVGNEYRADVLGARAAGLIPVLIDRNNLYQHADCLRFSSLCEWLERMG